MNRCLAGLLPLLAISGAEAAPKVKADAPTAYCPTQVGTVFVYSRPNNTDLVKTVTGVERAEDGLRVTVETVFTEGQGGAETTV